MPLAQVIFFFMTFKQMTERRCNVGQIPCEHELTTQSELKTMTVLSFLLYLFVKRLLIRSRYRAVSTMQNWRLSPVQDTRQLRFVQKVHQFVARCFFGRIYHPLKKQILSAIKGRMPSAIHNITLSGFLYLNLFSLSVCVLTALSFTQHISAGV